MKKTILIGSLILAFCLGILACVVYLSARVPMGRSPRGERLKRVESSSQYRDGKFRNRLPRDPFSIEDVVWTLNKYLFGKEVRRPRSPLPVEKLTAESFSTPPRSRLRLTWLGHSTVFIEMDGYTILTDPVFGERASPLTWVGPKRFHPVPITIEELPDIDAVVISHDHYDHLDYKSIVALVPKTRMFYLPLGVGEHLEWWNVSREKIVELDWWQEAPMGRTLRFVATPARHFSGRGLRDGDKTLWASWSIIGRRHRVFFSGDTGMDPDLGAIGDRYGPFDATVIKSGAYGETWPEIHLNPEEAVALHRMVRGAVMLPVHWGTFKLSYHGWAEPAERVRAAAEEAGIGIVIPIPGESVIPDAPGPVNRWWIEVQ